MCSQDYNGKEDSGYSLMTGSTEYSGRFEYRNPISEPDTYRFYRSL